MSTMALKEKYWFADDLTVHQTRRVTASRVCRSLSNMSLNSVDCDMNLTTSGSPSGIAPLDLITIKHIYEKALLVTKLEEEAQVKELEMALAKIEDLPDDLPKNGIEARDARDVRDVRDARRNLLRFRSDEKPNGLKTWERELESPNSLRDDRSECWSPPELHVLRQFYERTREENGRLRLLLNVREEELTLIRDKYKKQEDALELALAELKVSDKTAKQMEESNKQAKSRCSLLTKELKNAKEDLKYCQDGRDRLAKEVLRLEKDFNLEREARAKLETNLHQVIQEKQKDMLSLEDNWKQLHRAEVGRLVRTVAELNQKLAKEEDVRKCIQMGLSSLHRHVPRTADPDARFSALFSQRP